ncbi:hypothetical protein TST_0699 [Thermosulfidibacter takaii ABI70S6]|uniref:Cell division protein ZapA n=1 Tax=Thermosulfidibacter takaii (strain DSM 17441 / JCM 13301 / NBRC 103674 / ABI70S6) TaxID=1298851 RepID=A0A0S3QT35_THET7|nr:hypothetical protein [Thermosulfidibacter takaii]BAT71504.1 hypothetical protein TST_0699 [Thermosulfidibacter takaii ABI70S6]
MAGREFEFSLFGTKCRVRGPLIGDREVEEIQKYLEATFNLVLGPGPAKTVASNLMKDKALLPIILKISWDYLKLKKQLEENTREIENRVDEALRLAEFLIERGGE